MIILNPAKQGMKNLGIFVKNNPITKLVKVKKDKNLKMLFEDLSNNTANGNRKIITPVFVLPNEVLKEISKRYSMKAGIELITCPYCSFNKIENLGIEEEKYG